MVDHPEATQTFAKEEAQEEVQIPVKATSGIKSLFENSLILAAGRKPYAPVKTAPNVPVLKVNSISRAKQRKASAFGGRRKLTVGAVVVDNTYDQDDTEITDSMVARGHAGNPVTENIVSTTTGASMMLTESTKEPLRGAVNRMPGASRTIRVRKTS